MKEQTQNELVEAVLAVMEDVKGIDKSMNVGTGNNSYKGVADKDVKIAIGQSMRKHGLIILPVKITPTVTIERWEEDVTWNGQTQKKQKQQVFTEVITEYKLLHKSGQFEIIQGYGHGVDSQDKGAGKATTYALKYTLLYQFMVATGHIDDSDTTHSEDIQPPKQSKIKLNDIQWEKTKQKFTTGEVTREEIESKAILSVDQRNELDQL